MGSAPKAPDPYKQQQAQRGENIWTSQYNTIGQNANQYTPYGSVTNAPGTKIPIYDQQGNITGYGTQWNQTTQLSPQEQAIFDQEEAAKLGFGKLANQQLGNAQGVLGKAFSTEGLPDWQTYGQGPDLRYEKGPTDRAAIEKAMMDSYQRGVQPQQTAEDVTAAARGMGAPGSQYGYAVANQRGDAAAEQTRQAYLASGAESRAADQAANQALQQMMVNTRSATDQSNALRQAQYQERQGVRNQMLNELSVLAGNAPVTMPQGQAFQGSATNPFDIAGAQNQAYANATQAYQSKLNGLFGIAGAGLRILNPFGSFGAGGMFGK